MKLNKISIRGLRGIREELTINLQGKSALFYGDNGTGKSTIADVLEWLYNDSIDHLSGEEIGRNPNSAMRNIDLLDNTDSLLMLEIENLEISKSLSNNLKSVFCNSSPSIEKYMEASHNENFILRYRDLDNFVRSRKKDRLDKLSNIMGYSEISKIKAELNATYNTINKEIRAKDFDSQISNEQKKILEEIGCNITSDEHLVNEVNKKIGHLGLQNISSLTDIEHILEQIECTVDNTLTDKKSFLTNIEAVLKEIIENIDKLESEYELYKKSFNNIASNAEKLKELILEKLLSAGKEVLEKNNEPSPQCPLCLQEKDEVELLKLISDRLKGFENIKKEQENFNQSKQLLVNKIKLYQQKIATILSNLLINIDENETYKKEFDKLVKIFQEYEKLLVKDPANNKELSDKEKPLIDTNYFLMMCEKTKKSLLEIEKSINSNPSLKIYTAIKISSIAYARIKELKKQQTVYNKQLGNIEKIYKKFGQHQQEAFESFLTKFSERINAIYSRMQHESPSIEDIRLVPVEEDGNLLGITIELDFMKKVSPPHKYLSESYLNCIGIAFFLASVEAFNRKNKFIVLDDVISSFDNIHRKKFADLLIEEYKNYQLILLTHEDSWFEYLRNCVKGKNWLVKTIKHTDINGTFIDKPVANLKEKIEEKIIKNNSNNLAADVRIYLGFLLKKVAYSLETEFPFRFNDENELRMNYELLTGIKGTIKKRTSHNDGLPALSVNPIWERLINSNGIGNNDAHNDSKSSDIHDMKAFWEDVCIFENLFFCKECKTYVSKEYYNLAEKKISCKDGKITYPWT